MTKEEIAKNYVPCRCHQAYISRGLTAPDCPYHSTDPESAMDEYAKQQSIAFANYVMKDYTLSLHSESPILTDDQIYDQFIEQQNKQHGQ
jgi:hypothetical protein